MCVLFFVRTIQQKVWLLFKTLDQLSNLNIVFFFLLTLFINFWSSLFFFQNQILVFPIGLQYPDSTKLQVEKRFVSVIAIIFVYTAEEEIKHCSCQVRMRLISHLIKGISRVFHKIIKHFNGTAAPKCFVLPLTGVFPVVQILDFNDLEFFIALVGSFL